VAWSPHPPHPSGFGQIHPQIPTRKFDTISCGYGVLGTVIVHFHESETPGLACVAIINQFNGFDIAVRRKQITQLFICGFKRNISHID